WWVVVVGGSGGCVRDHPVVSRLLAYHSLLDRLSPLDERLAPQLKAVLQAAARNDGPRASHQPRPRRPIPAAEEVEEVVEEEVEEVEEEVDAEKALRFYDSVVQNLQQKRRDKQSKRMMMRRSVLTASEELKSPAGDGDGGDGDGGKRAITHQISRNRGLTAKRNKLDRNPRVKHREKFRRAKIRRAGQVRVVRSEIVRYGGEFSGIRAGVKKSIKLK
ncbi:something about silencing protein 10-like, partial [Petromyzon marinus]|uniref:something about silencing protein 10-like n=1 Tax=Petromyzon marinus TaxID=7757 RepID=UPI003F7154E5